MDGRLSAYYILSILRKENADLKAGYHKNSLALTLSATRVMGSIESDSISIVMTKEEASIKQFSFGTTEIDGYTRVTKDQLYSQEKGYGFSTKEFKEEAAGWIDGVYYERQAAVINGDSTYITDHDDYMEVGSKGWTETESTGYGVYTYENTSTFDVNLEPADYTVSVELVNPTTQSITAALQAEDITKVSGITIGAGETVKQSYTACLVDGTLNLKFLAASTAIAETDAVLSSVYVSKVKIEKQTRQAAEKPTIFIASDSTVQTYDEYYYPQTGWGQVLYNFFKGHEDVSVYECEDCNYSQSQTYETSSVIVENRSIGGRSSKSFIEEGKLDDLLEDVKPGDYVLVQWGHNDATAARPNRYVASSHFEKQLQYYIDGVTQRGGACILVTPVARRSYTENNGVASFKSDFEAYRQVMLRIGEEQNVPVLDLTKASIDVCNRFGAEGSKALFLWLNAGDYTGAYAGGISDATHLQYYGAYKFAQCVAKLIESYEKDSRLDGLKQILDLTSDYPDVPAIPQCLETMTIGSASVSFSWEKIDYAESYYIYRTELEEGQTAEDVSFEGTEKYSVSAKNSYTDSSCQGGKTYVYAVAGFNEVGIGNLSEKIAVTTKSALYKYDFCQTASNPTLKEWTQVTSTQAYSKEAGYGFITAPGNGGYREGNGNADSNDMTDDFCLGAGEFAVDLPNGDYEVTVIACDLMSGTSTIKPSYSVEGNSIGTISTKQAAATVSATVRVEDGQLNLTIGGTNPYINGLEITSISLAPDGLLYQELTFEGNQGNFLLNWKDTEGAVSYNVYRKGETDSTFALIKNITSEEKANETTLPFAATAGETYEYYVTALFADESESARSNVISIEMIDDAEDYPETPVNVICAKAEAVISPVTSVVTQAKAEMLTDRALVAINLAGDPGTGIDENGKEGSKVSSADSGVYVSWRLFEEDGAGVTFTLYRNDSVIAEGLAVTNYLDALGTAADTYKVVGSTDEALGLQSASVATWQNQYVEYQLDKPADQTMPDGTICSYTANDMSVGDLDGDGKYELIVKWYPSNAKDNSGSGYTGTTILDAYDIDYNTGEAVKLWRIDLGINIRSGAHYTQFQVWDLDGDGCAELVCKTADGTVDGEGTVIGDAAADYRNSSGYVLDGPEYLTVFNGKTGAIIDTVDYIPARGTVSAWGDSYGNRVDRFLSAVAYLDGENPSVVFCRGYYTRTCLTAFDLVNGKLVKRWAFDTDTAGSQYESQGNHSLSINDVDGDGKDEIVYGSLTLDDDGTVLYSTGLGHGDAMHVSDWIPSRKGLEVFSVHEHTDAAYQVEMHDAETGEIIFGYFTGKDTGRCVAADVDPTAEGAEFWSSIEWNGTNGGMYSSLSTFEKPVLLSETTPSVNFTIFWDGDLLNELQDHTFNDSGSNYYPVSTNITKWDYENKKSVTLFESAEIFTSNGTKGNMGLVADILGDWREEIIARCAADDSKIRIYSTTIETDYSIPCLMEDHQYRVGVAAQNVGYNQPAHLSYLLTKGLKTAEVAVASTTMEAVNLTWTAASDGVHGHDVTGYIIYRLNKENKEYEEIGRTSLEQEEILTFTDSNVEQNAEYTYKVAAIVDGKASYRSNPVAAVTALNIKAVKELEKLELAADQSDYQTLISTIVEAVDAEDHE